MNEEKTMEQAPSTKKPAGRPKKKKSTLKPIIAIIVVLAILGGAAYYIVPLLTKKSDTALALTEVTVKRGDISKSISGSGEVEPVQKYTVLPTVTGQILSDNLTQGQKINKGDLIYAIDPTNANNTIQQNQNALERAQLTYSQNAVTAGYLTVSADISGVVKKVYVKNGDQVNANAAIIDVEDAASLILTIPFNAADVSKLSLGEAAQVTLATTGTVLSGTVTRLYTGQQIGSNGAVVTNIDITMANPGAVVSGTAATAVVGGQFACNAAGTIAYNASKTITAKTSGQVQGLTLMVGDSVHSGATVATLQNDATTAALQTASLQVQNAQLVLQNAQDALKNYNLTSPISGTVIEKDMKAGDTISSTSSTNTMAVIADMTSLVLTIDVDELDILSIKVGQTAKITADAVASKTFTGQVTNISMIGNSGSSTSSSSSSSGTGVTTYAVQITISDYGALLPGMNVNASIVLDSATNALLIPEQAVLAGGYVMRKISGSAAPTTSVTPSPSPAAPSGAAAASGNAASAAANRLKQLEAKLPKGYELVKVQVGLTDGASAEIKSGVNEGDTIGYETAAASTAKASNNANSFSFGGSGQSRPSGSGSYGGSGSGSGGNNNGSGSYPRG